MEAKIILLPGDGIGPEVVAEARACLEAVALSFGHSFVFEEHPIGGAAIDAHGVPLPDSTLEACRHSDAVLLGAVGGPKWDSLPAGHRPESGLLSLRKELGLFANIRPVQVHDAMLESSPLRPAIVRGTDMLFVRELLGGLYFGEPRMLSQDRALNSMTYTREEILRVAKVAFTIARDRRGHLVSVDLANVLEASRLWRSVVEEVAREFPEVTVTHSYVDSFAPALLSRPTDFDVVLAENMFGDILSDEAAVLAGSLALLPSASLGGKVGLYEPIHGSAPDLAGRDLANPIGTILSAALLLRHGLGLHIEAGVVEAAVDQVLASGHGTRDLASIAHVEGTRAIGARIRKRISRPPRVSASEHLPAHTWWGSPEGTFHS